jgi:serine/threonine protein kinase
MQLAVGTVLDGKYALIHQIGSGGAGAVYEAEHLIVGKRVAIKILDPALAKNRAIRMSFVGEARAAAQIGHANVVDIYDLGVTDDGWTYLVMELIRGETLDAVLRERGALGPAYSCELMLQVLAGLEAAHAEGIVHRDLKPANVMVTHPRPDRPLVKVLDFGIARGVADAIAEDGADAPVYGTPAYMAPEQTMAEAVDARADVYSAAVMLFEMLTGCDPVDGNSPTEVMMNALLGRHRQVRDSNPGVPLGLAAIVERAMSRDPDDRPSSARELAALLRPFVEPERVLSFGPMPGTTTAPIPLVGPGAPRPVGACAFTVPGPAPEFVRVSVPVVDLVSLSPVRRQRELSDAELRIPQIPKAPATPQPHGERGLDQAASPCPVGGAPLTRPGRSLPLRAQAEARRMSNALRAILTGSITAGIGATLGWGAFLWWQ